MAKTRSHKDEYGVYGFDTGNASVTRICNVNGTQVLSVESDHAKIEIWISPAGRKITVKGKEGNVLFLK